MRKPKVYRGTAFPKDIEVKTDADLLYGKGIYFTESPKLAKEYSTKVRVYDALTNSWRIIDKPEGGEVSGFTVNIKNPFDIDKTYSKEETNKILSAFPRVPTIDVGLKGIQIFQILEQGEKHSYSRNEIVEGLKKLEYDGLTHIGGRQYDQFDG